MESQLLNILACPRCKGKVSLTGDKSGLACSPCGLTYPVRNGVPVLMVEEASSSEARREAGRPAPPVQAGEAPEQVRLLIVEGNNKGEAIELEKGSCRALGRSLEDAAETRVFSVASTVSLDDFSKKLVMNYISRQFKKPPVPAAAGEGGETLGIFRRLADIYLRDKAISRLHAMIFFDESGVGILDLVSKNGTFVNGVEVESKLLQPGDLIALGATKLRRE